MKIEYLDILDDNGNSLGHISSKEEAHAKGWFHATVHIWFYTKDGQVLFQKRGANKETFPSYWDVSVAGHVMAGESIKNSVLREVKEEIGLKINTEDLNELFIKKSINIHPNGIKDCEFQNVFSSSRSESSFCSAKSFFSVWVSRCFLASRKFLDLSFLSSTAVLKFSGME